MMKCKPCLLRLLIIAMALCMMLILYADIALMKEEMKEVPKEPEQEEKEPPEKATSALHWQIQNGFDTSKEQH